MQHCTPSMQHRGPLHDSTSSIPRRFLHASRMQSRYQCGHAPEVVTGVGFGGNTAKVSERVETTMCHGWGRNGVRTWRLCD
jgi:hypothetical protein